MPTANDDDLTELARAIREARSISLPLAENAIAVGLTAIRVRLAPYPPQPDRDRAKPPGVKSPYNTYVRGIGHFPKSSFTQVNGLWERKQKNAYRPGPKGGKVRRTSEQLDKKWRIELRSQGDSASGTLTNDASYSGSVIGHRSGADASDGVGTQEPYHDQTGWENMDDAIEQARPEFDAAVDQAINAIIAYITE